MRRAPEDCAKRLVTAGVQLFQYRAKRNTPREVFDFSKRLIQLLAPYRAWVVVNDRPDIAALTSARGVHVGQDDLPPEEARSVCGRGSWVGISTHNADQVREAEKTSIDYVAVGPIFPTSTKENPDPVLGTEFIRAARELTQKPIVAIGGITLTRAREVFEAGADSIAIIRDLVGAENPEEQAREFLRIAEISRWSKRVVTRSFENHG
jgi:thiamine-phosphate pyrophosphorylase